MDELNENYYKSICYEFSIKKEKQPSYSVELEMVAFLQFINKFSPAQVKCTHLPVA